MFIPVGLSRAIFRADDIIRRRGVWSLYRLLQKSQWWSREELEAFQLEKLRALLRHGYEHSPYYRETMEAAGVRTDDIRGLDDLARLPLLTRDHIRAHGETIRSRGVPEKDLLPNNTSGSSGSITRFWVDRECWRWRDAVFLQVWERVGLRACEPTVNVWGCPIDDVWALSLPTRVRRFFDNKRLVSAYQLGDEEVPQLVAYVARMKPTILTGYTSALDTIATQVRRRGLRWPHIHGLTVVTQAETLYPEQRRNIETAFRAHVLNLYGSRELGTIALECRAGGGLHVVEERHIVELLPDPETGWHRLVITDLHSKGFPLIRYDIGDLAEVSDDEPCACGRAHRALREIHGRSLSVVRSSEGKAVAGNFFSFLLREAVEGVEAWQVVQTAQDAVEIRVAPAQVLTEHARNKITEEIRRALGPAMVVVFRGETRLEPLPSGKHHFVVALPTAPTSLRGSSPTR